MRVRVAVPGPHDVLALEGELRAVYADAFSQPHRPVPAREVDYFAGELESAVTWPGFRCVVAHGDDELVGFAHGHLDCSDDLVTDWCRRLNMSLAAEFGACANPGPFLLHWLAVRPGWHRRGVGARLHDALLDDVWERRAWLVVRSSDARAWRFYRQRGWRPLSGLSLPPWYTGMGLDVPGWRQASLVQTSGGECHVGLCGGPSGRVEGMVDASQRLWRGECSNSTRVICGPQVACDSGHQGWVRLQLAEQVEALRLAR